MHASHLLCAHRQYATVQCAAHAARCKTTPRREYIAQCTRADSIAPVAKVILLPAIGTRGKCGWFARTLPYGDTRTEIPAFRLQHGYLCYEQVAHKHTDYERTPTSMVPWRMSGRSCSQPPAGRTGTSLSTSSLATLSGGATASILLAVVAGTSTPSVVALERTELRLTSAAAVAALWARNASRSGRGGLGTSGLRSCGFAVYVRRPLWLSHGFGTGMVRGWRG